MEGRGEAEGKPADGNTFREQTREDVLTIVERVGERAKQKRGEKFTTLLSHVKVPLLKEAYQRLRKKAAAGVDGQTWSSYGEQRGHYQYYGVPGNSRALNSFRESVRYLWHKRLQRRSQRASWTTQKRTRFDRRFPLPAPRIVHPYPTTRFRERHARR